MTSTPERVVLEEDGITVTTTRIQATGRQYPGFVIPISTVASVYELGAGAGARARRAVEAWALALILLAMYLMVAQQFEILSAWLASVSAVVFLLSRPASPTWKALNARRRLIEVCDASGQVHVLRPSTYGVGQRVYAAIQEAIAQAGT